MPQMPYPQQPQQYPAISEQEQRALEAARRGEPGGFARLQQALEPAVQRFLYRLLGRLTGGTVEEDIVRTVFLALYRNLERIDAERLRPFVFRVTRNLCYEELRRSGRTTATVSLNQPRGETLLACLPDRRPRPEETLFWAQATAEVTRAIDALPEPQRIALLLHAEEGMSYQQIAEATSADLGTVKSRIHNARKGLMRRVRPDTLAALGLTNEEG